MFQGERPKPTHGWVRYSPRFAARGGTRYTRKKRFPTQSSFMTNQQWIIGSDQEADLRVDDVRISGRHCRLSQQGDRFFIEDLASRNGTFVGSERVATKTHIAAGAKVRLADNVLMPWPVDSLAKVMIRIGRANTNDVVVADDSVSAKHAVLFRDPNDVWILRDLGSTNGTRLDDRDRIVAAARVTQGDVVHLGTVTETLGNLTRNAEPHPGKLKANIPSKSASKPASKPDATLVSKSTSAGKPTPATRRASKITVAVVLMTGLLSLFLAGFFVKKMASSWEPTDAPETETQPNDQALSMETTSMFVVEEKTPRSPTSERSPASGRSPASESVTIAEVSPAEVVQPTPTLTRSGLDRVRDAIFVVIVDYVDDEGNPFEIEVATAWAASPEVLVTNASVVSALMRVSDSVKLIHLNSGTKVGVDSMGLHKDYTSRRQRVNLAKQRVSDLKAIPESPDAASRTPADLEMAETQLRERMQTLPVLEADADAVDVAWIRIEPTNQTFSHLADDSLTPMQKGHRLRLVKSSIFSAEEYAEFQQDPDRSIDFLNVTASELVALQSATTTKRWLAKFQSTSLDYQDFMFHGCPIVSLRGKLLGMYRGPARTVGASLLEPDSTEQSSDEFDMVPSATVRAMLQQITSGNDR